MSRSWQYGKPKCSDSEDLARFFVLTSHLVPGASLADPHRLFNNGFGGKVWHAIDLFEGDTVDARALTALVRAAIEHNQVKAKKPRKPGARA